MPRPSKPLPRYLKHSSGKARIVWTDPTGVRRERILPGKFGSEESRQAFARLQLELATAPATVARITGGPTVAEILLPYLKHAADYYGDTSERDTIKDALRVVREVYGHSPATEFGPKALAAVREAMIRKGWSRTYINRQVGRVTRAFKWAAAEELIPAGMYQALKTLTALRAGKTDARESEARTPADPTAVAATLPLLPPHTRALVDLLRLTGMRPGEACRMTLGQIARSGEVWVYSPKRHKNKHRGKHRAVALGATAQAVIAAHLAGKVVGPDEPLFSPLRQRQERFEAMRSRRKSKVQPSQTDRRKAEPKRLPGAWFNPEAVCHAVQKACRKAGVDLWSPYQLRHLKGAELREKFTLEHVRAVLGHSHASMSAHYAKGADAALAAEVATKVG